MSTSTDIMAILPVSMVPYLDQIVEYLQRLEEMTVNESSRPIDIFIITSHFGDQCFFLQMEAMWKLYPESMIQTLAKSLSTLFRLPEEEVMDQYREATSEKKISPKHFFSAVTSTTRKHLDATIENPVLRLATANILYEFMEKFTNALAHEKDICKAFENHVESITDSAVNGFMEKLLMVPGLMEKVDESGQGMDRIQERISELAEERLGAQKLSEPELRALYASCMETVLDEFHVEDGMARRFISDYMMKVPVQMFLLGRTLVTAKDAIMDVVARATAQAEAGAEA